MLYYLLYPLKDLWAGFNIFKYITFRAAMASVTAFFLSILLGPIIIRALSRLKLGQSIRKDHVEDLYELHKHKGGTPTMGGLLIIASIIFSTMLWSRFDNRFIILCLICIIWLGLVGFLDDYIKVIRKRNLGLGASAKFIGQVVFSMAVAVYLYAFNIVSTDLYLPFFKNVVINMGVCYVLFAVFVIVGASNAVNLTDGLDGLAIGCVTIAAGAFGIISYMAGNASQAAYLNIFYLPGGGELTVLCAAIVGSGFGFLWFNSHPAQVFMGDTGSLALGGVLGLISILIKKEVLLVVTGGIFVAEVVSVILQVLSVKTRKKKLFRMSPLHHHFQLAGMHESKVIIRFWIVAIMLALFSLITLKIQ